MEYEKRIFLDSVHETSWMAIVFVCLTATAAVLAYLWVKPLAVGIFWIATVVCGVFLLGRQRHTDLGLAGRNILPGIAYALLYWFVALSAMTAYAYVTGTPLHWPVFEEYIAPFIEQLFVYALAEEIVFRGFILAQLYRKFHRVFGHPILSLTIAILMSQLLFALWHIPSHLSVHESAAQMLPSLASVFAAGVLISLVYIRSGNLFMALSVHALANVPGLYAGAVNSWSQLAIMGVGVILADFYARLERKRGVKNINQNDSNAAKLSGL